MSQRCCKRAVDRVRVRVVTITGLVPEIPISMGTPADATGESLRGRSRGELVAEGFHLAFALRVGSLLIPGRR